jgi:hypothetical protein
MTAIAQVHLGSCDKTAEGDSKNFASPPNSRQRGGDKAPSEMKTALVFAAVGELTTGIALVIMPSLVTHLLLGQELVGVGVHVARVAGIALVGLGISLWPGPPLVGMLIYSAVVALYLAYLGFAVGLTGILLWPAVVVHAILTALLAWALRVRKSVRASDG